MVRTSVGPGYHIVSGLNSELYASFADNSKGLQLAHTYIVLYD